MHDQTDTTGFSPFSTRLRYDSALHGTAMPAVGVKSDTGITCIALCEIGLRSAGPRFVFAHGRSAPVSRGSPPVFKDDR
jgi:hypothetical protein